mgnify:CR=1 FL=1
MGMTDKSDRLEGKRRRKVRLFVTFTPAQLERLFEAIDYALQSDPMMGPKDEKSLRIAREAIRAAYYEEMA